MQKTAGMVMKVSPGPALGFNPKANTGGITIKPASNADTKARKATQMADEGKVFFMTDVRAVGNHNAHAQRQ